LKTWSTACPDWERRILAGESLIAFPPLFQAEADGALRAFNSMRLVDVAGTPTMADVSRKWTTDFVAAIFGAYDVEAGRRLITEFFLLISKKNSKSTNAAGIMMTALTRNWRKEGEYLILAPTKEIAENSYKPAASMVRADEELLDMYHVQDHVRTITHRDSGASLKIVAADSDAVSGKKAIGVLVDELWLFGKQPNAENMLREATGGLASRPEGFTIYLSTQSDAVPAGVFAQKLDYARGVRDGRIEDPQFLPVLYEFPQAVLDREDHKKPEFFYVTNPNLGSSVDTAYLEREMRKAKVEGEASLRGFMAKHLNVEVGLTLHGKRWPGADHWEKNAAAVTLQEMFARSDVICIGIDGGGLDDLLSLVAIGRDAEPRPDDPTQRDWTHWQHSWAHESVLERNQQEAARFRDFEKAGELTVVENIGDDIAGLVAFVKEIEESGLLDRVGVDQAGIGAIVDALVDADIEFERIVGISQGWRLYGAIVTCERKLAVGGMKHGSTKIMNFAVGNAKAEKRGNAIIITKQGSGSAKIDPLLATFDAVALMSMNPKPRKKLHQLLIF
jgi:phage terminase large subunit-like protein